MSWQQVRILSNWSSRARLTSRARDFITRPYQEQGTGAKKVMLGTQFEATDARRMFPCWDEPVFRSRFQLTAVVPEKFTAVSNMPVEKETKVADGKKEFRFGMTPPMPSYLNVLCAGEVDGIFAKVNGVDHGVIATKGKAEMGRYALESSQQILEYMNDYFGQPYPLPKLDHIAVPGGFGGAMENWGGITYYESRLLFDPEKSSAETKQGIYEVIAHETAHMWFGDLVTMAWWDNLWLNEGFASWMGTKCTAKFNPDWEVWLSKNTPRDPTRRHGIGKEGAMEGDARSTTHPIQQPVANEAEASSAFDDITYRKGLAFITMLESFLGEEVFREGIRKYMAKHKLSNTTTADLWNSLSEASGQPVGEIAAAWTEQPGFPIVKVARDPQGKITLTQERFTVHFENAPPLEWKIPLTYTVPGTPATASLLMTSKSMELPNSSGRSRGEIERGGRRATIASSTTRSRGSCSWRNCRSLATPTASISSTTRGRSCRPIARRCRSISAWSKNCRPKPSWPSASKSCTCSISSTGFWPASRSASNSRNMRARSCGRASMKWAGSRRAASRSRSQCCGEPDQCARRSWMTRRSWRVAASVSKIFGRPEIACAGSAPAGPGSRRPLCG